MELQYWTLDQLRAFDGESNPRILVAVLGEVYDVSSDALSYGPGGEYHLLAGREASRALARMSFTNEDVNNLDLSDLTKAERQVLEEWIVEFRKEKKYPVAGRVLTCGNYTMQQLSQFDGVQDPWHRVYVALNGTIYDVTLSGLHLYGPEGKFPFCAGHNVSRAFATMHIDKETVTHTDLSDLSDEQRLLLADWGLRFAGRYPTVGRLRTELEP